MMVVELFDPEDERATVLRSVGNSAPCYTASSQQNLCAKLSYRQSEARRLVSNGLSAVRCNV